MKYFVRLAVAAGATAALGSSCAHDAAAPTSPQTASATNTAASSAAPSERWCGPIRCPGWLASEPAASPLRALPLRERCNLLSKVVTYQPLSLVGRPLSAFEASQRTGVGRIDNRLAAAVTLRDSEPGAEHSLFTQGETCGAGILVIAPSTSMFTTRAEAEAASSIFKLALTPATPGSTNELDFALTLEPIAKADAAASADFKPLHGRLVRGTGSTAPDSWMVVVHATLDSADALQ